LENLESVKNIAHKAMTQQYSKRAEFVTVHFVLAGVAIK
jgi:hypothetical protein